jgi:cyclic lactone autoinducer peptide
MFKKTVYKFASVLSIMAVMVVSTASFVYIFQGETPDELLNK